MGIFGLIFLAVMLVLIGVSLAVGLVACAIAAVLLGLGVVSSSVVIGWGSRRPAFGIRAFLLQCGVLAGIPAGAVCGWIVQLFLTEPGVWPGLIYGALGGAVAGVAIAVMLDFTLRAFHRWIVARFPIVSPMSSLNSSAVGGASGSV